MFSYTVSFAVQRILEPVVGSQQKTQVNGNVYTNEPLEVRSLPNPDPDQKIVVLIIRRDVRACGFC